jgi:hypothetical protein
VPRKASSIKFENPGATPAISAHESAVATKTWNGLDKPAVAQAFDAKNISQPIYTSAQNSKRDRAAQATRFVSRWWRMDACMLRRAGKSMRMVS